MKDFKLHRGTLPELLSKIRQVVLSGKTYRLSIEEWSKKRGLSANAQQHVFYSQIAKHYGDITALDVKNMCKDMFGLPILLRCDTNKDKITYLLDKLEYYRHKYENRMKIIQCLSITSELNTKQSKEYMDNMIYYFNNNGININYKN